MRLVETPPRYPPFTGGVENVAQAVCSRLVALGDDVLVICADEPRNCPDFGDGVPIRRLAWKWKIANTNITLGLPWALIREPWDVVHTHLPTPWSCDWSVLIARLLGRGSVVSFYNEIVGEGAADYAARLYRATFYRLTLHLADRIIVVSDAWRDELASLSPSIAAKITVIPTGVDLERFAVPRRHSGTELLFVGILDRFHRYKGLDVLLEALSQLGEPFHLTVVGDGELRGEYERQANQAGIGDQVEFVGRISDDELRDQYAAAAIYVLPSDFARQEGGFTLTALEAMASGLPVILADGAGQISREADDAGAGVRTPAGDAPALTQALKRLLGDAELRTKMGEAARTFAERRHSWDAITMDRRELYREVGAEARARRRQSSIGSPAGTR
jgi:glycosyltransferase involved in cell wall biosynthesis